MYTQGQTVLASHMLDMTNVFTSINMSFTSTDILVFSFLKACTLLLRIHAKQTKIKLKVRQNKLLRPL